MNKRIAVLTSGGDAPGMNNAIRAIIKASFIAGFEPYVVYEGYKGLVAGNIKKARARDFDEYLNRGGTKIYSARLPEFAKLEVREKAVANLKAKGIDALVVIGGDGSYKGAIKLSDMGIKTIALPGTIDNDIASSDYTIGYFTALNTIVESIEKIRDTAKSHKRIMIVETMGRHCGDLAIYAAMASGANFVVTPENKIDTNEMIKLAKTGFENGHDTITFIVTEHLYDVKLEAKKVGAALNVSTRSVVLGHVQRGGNPVTMDRILATSMGIYAIDLLKENKTGLCIGYRNGKLEAIEIHKALAMKSPSRINDIDIINKINSL